MRERVPPFTPEQVVEDFAALCKTYRISKVTGDHYAGEFPRELFRKHGISYEVAKQTKSELFRDLLPLLNSTRIVLPRNDRLVQQIVSLERRVAAGVILLVRFIEQTKPKHCKCKNRQST